MAKKDWFSQVSDASGNNTLGLTEEEKQQATKDAEKYYKYSNTESEQITQNYSKQSYTSASGKTFKPEKGWVISTRGKEYIDASGSPLEKYGAGASYKTEINGMTFVFPEEMMASLTPEKRENIVARTMSAGRMLTDDEAKQILGGLNFENKLAWYHLMVDKNCLNFGFASNGKAPQIDPATGQLQYNDQGVLVTDPNATVVPGPITVSSVTNALGQQTIQIENPEGETQQIVQNENGTFDILSTDNKGNSTETTVNDNWSGDSETLSKATSSSTDSSNFWNSIETKPFESNSTPQGSQQETPTGTPPETFVGDAVPEIDDRGSGIDQFYRQNLDTLNVDPNSQYSNMYKQSMYGAINAQEQMSNATLAQAELDAYKMLGQQQLELENQIASQRMQAIKSGVTSAQLASQQLANIFAAQSGAAQVAQGVLDQKTSNAYNFAQQRANVTTNLYDMLQQNQSTMANTNTQMAAALAGYSSYVDQPYAQYNAASYWREKLGDYGMYITTGGTPIEILNATKQQ